MGPHQQYSGVTFVSALRIHSWQPPETISDAKDFALQNLCKAIALPTPKLISSECNAGDRHRFLPGLGLELPRKRWIGNGGAGVERQVEELICGQRYRGTDQVNWRLTFKLVWI